MHAANTCGRQLDRQQGPRASVDTNAKPYQVVRLRDIPELRAAQGECADMALRPRSRVAGKFRLDKCIRADISLLDLQVEAFAV
jgi:hypothetical protein